MYTPPNKILEKLKNLPTSPGVYLYSNSKKKIIYIGKAKNLRSRIKSYFLNIGKHQQFKTEILVQKIDNIEYILTDNELEALLLESNLIKKHKPKYNIDLKDDKSYPYIRITKELFPRVFITRKIVRDGSKYLGPYTQVKAIRAILKSLKKILKIRNCALDITDDSIKSKKHKLCLDYHIKICNGVCRGLEEISDYKKSIKNIESFVTGNDVELLKQLNDKMLESSENLEFELAAKYRDQIRTLEDYRLKQKVQSAGDTPQDYIAVATEDNDSCCVVFKVRNGSLIARNHFFLSGAYNKNNLEVLEEFIKIYYNPNSFDDNETLNTNSENYVVPDFFPDEIILESEIEDKDAVTDWLNTLSERKGKPNKKQISLKIPMIGDKSKMIFLAKKNAEMLLNDRKLEKLKKDYTPRSLNSLKRDLNLPRLPKIIECFDISHFAGRETVASMVCFKNAKPLKSRYRRFKINTVEGIDDFASMREVVERRYTRLKNDFEKDPKNSEVLPDLIMVDGGKGQLSSAVEILKRLDLYDKIPVIGLAKRLEEVFKPNESESEMIPRTSSALKLLQQLRDEAHRFAITYHRNLRAKSHIKSELDDIDGLGPKKRELLIKTFGSLKKIKESKIDNLLKVKGITHKIAEEILKINPN